MNELTANSILSVIGIVTAIFWCGIFIGTIWNKLARHEDRLDSHDDELRALRGLR